MKRSVPTPHDHYFRAAMIRPEVHKPFFEAHLPAAIRKQMDLNTLKLCKESFIDKELIESITDLLFSVDFLHGKQRMRGYIYLLVEHRSTPLRLLPLKMLKYLISALENHCKEKSTEQLPVIVPLVFYHGEKTPYPQPVQLLDLFEDPSGIMKEYLSSRFHLVDVGQIPDAVLKEKAWLNVLQFCLKHIYDRDFLRCMPEIIALWQQLTRIGGTNPEDYIVESSHYLLNAAEISDKKAFIEMIQQNLTPNIGERVMTIGQLFKEEGRQEGRQEGIEEGIAKGHLKAQKDIAHSLLENGMGIEKVSRLTKLPIPVIQAIEKELKQAQH
jgi:predicted transposase/invertase (TIGR01784 family)